MIVVDSNIIFSALLNAESVFLSAISDSKYKFVSPYFLFVEIFKHKEKILKYTKISESELLVTLDSLLSNIQFVPVNILTLPSRQRAYNLCKDIDANDAPFVALALEFDGLLWTGDRKLVKGLREKGFNDFFQP